MQFLLWFRGGSCAPLKKPTEISVICVCLCYAEPSVLVAYLVTQKALTNRCLHRPGYLCPVMSGITWPGSCALQDTSCLPLMQHTSACWLRTSNFYSSHVPSHVKHTWDGDFWEKGHKLCWERSGAETDQSVSVQLRRTLESWCKITLESGGLPEATGIFPKDMVRFCDSKKTFHTGSSKRSLFPFVFINFTGVCYYSIGTGVI